MHYLDVSCGIEIKSMAEYIDTLTKLFAKEIYWNASDNNFMEHYFESYINHKFNPDIDFFYLEFLYNHAKKGNLALSFSCSTLNIRVSPPKKLFEPKELDKAIAYAQMRLIPNEKVTNF